MRAKTAPESVGTHLAREVIGALIAVVIYRHGGWGWVFAYLAVMVTLALVLWALADRVEGWSR